MHQRTQHTHAQMHTACTQHAHATLGLSEAGQLEPPHLFT